MSTSTDRIIDDINVSNLKILQSFLIANAHRVQDHLDMSTFCNFANESPYEVRHAFDEEINHCGTTLCLAGWSAVIPEFSAVARKHDDYPEMIDELYSSRRWVFEYLFGAEWKNNLSDGILRIGRLIDAVEYGDEDFLVYLRENIDAIVAIHGVDECFEDYEGPQGDIESIEEAKAIYPVYTVPVWFKETL